jgi:curved DNA-binding protein CbpA
MGGNKATATGTLGNTPFCELLVYGLSNGLTGSLVFECPNRTKHAIVLRSGSPVKGRVDEPSTKLGDVLQSLGFVDAAARKAAEARPAGELFGQRLCALGALDETALGRGLAEQLGRQLGWLSKAPGATGFAYFDGVNLLEHWAGAEVPIDPLAAIWRAIEASAPAERVEETCRGFAGATLRLHPASRIGRFGFGNRERSLLDVLRMKPQGLAELEATGLVDRMIVRKLVYALALTRHLDTGEQPLAVDAQAAIAPPASIRRRTPAPRSQARPPHSVAEPTPPVEEAAAEEPQGRPVSQTGRFLSRSEIETKVASLEEMTHYDVLEIPTNASAEEIGRAFPALARRWHPDRLSPDLGDLREAVTRMFARMTEASRVLGQGASRQEYDRLLNLSEKADNEQAQVEQVLRAAEAFQKAEIMLKKRDADAALKFAKAAHMGDPAQPEYAALYAWIRARRAGISEEDLKECLEQLQAAVAKQSDNVRIRYYLGCVLKLSGKANQALREFRFVADNDPSNLDAVRELRLHDMRRQSKPPGAAAEGAGLFSRLFKR